MILLAFNVAGFIGRFHPVLVHMPVGILMLAALFIALSVYDRFKSLKVAITISLVTGMVSAVASCVTGFLLSKTDSYESTLLFKHQWYAIAVAIVSAIVLYLHLKNRETRWGAGLMVLLVMITGHLGGSITHGSDFLTKAFSSGGGGSDPFGKPIPNVQETVAYTAIIKPILDSKCLSCHGPNKQKGRLRLDDPSFILKGGEDGAAVIAGKPLESALMKRILLSRENKDHMPPPEKPQLTKQDIDLLNWWISTGANFDRKVKELEQSDKIKSILKSLESEKAVEEIPLSDVPEQPVEKGSEEAIQKLKERGIAVVPISQNSNYLSANFVAVEGFNPKDLQLLEPVKKQLIWLKLGNMAVTDDALESLGKLSNLRMLHLQKTKITDQGLPQLIKIQELKFMNLGGTNVSAKGVEQLKGLKNLRQLYLYQTSISAEELNNLKKLFPKVEIEAGGYQVPALDGDTTVLKGPITK